LTGGDAFPPQTQQLKGTQQQEQGVAAEEKSFYDIAKNAGTDKVAAVQKLPLCLADDSKCTRPSCEREKCRPWGHFYHTMYQSRLGKYTLPGTEPFQFLEIGYVSLFSQHSLLLL
jgi:hypothetical protein